MQVFYGKVLITEALSHIEEVDDRTGDVRDRWSPQANSAKFDNAHAFWVHSGAHADEAAAGVPALQHLLRVGAVFSIPLDAHDIFPHAVVKDGKAYIVETCPGGIGIARKALEKWRNILSVGIEVAESCNCKKGCPNCIVPSRSREELDKRAGISLAHALREAAEGAFDYKFDNGIWEKQRTRASTIHE